MRFLLSPAGVPYVADADEAQPGVKPRSLLSQAIIFMLVFAMLQAVYGAARGTWAERLFIDSATVKPAAMLANAITPAVHAVASGTRLHAPGGGINVLNGCEGADALFLLVSAFVACPLPWVTRALGMLTGIAFLFMLNQFRILALFYSYRADRTLFDSLHGTVAPIVLIILTVCFFLFWVNKTGDGSHARETA